MKPTPVLLPDLMDDVSMWRHQSTHLVDVSDSLPFGLLVQTTVVEGAEAVLA